MDDKLLDTIEDCYYKTETLKYKAINKTISKSEITNSCVALESILNSNVKNVIDFWNVNVKVGLLFGLGFLIFSIAFLVFSYATTLTSICGVFLGWECIVFLAVSHIIRKRYYEAKRNLDFIHSLEN